LSVENKAAARGKHKNFSFRAIQALHYVVFNIMHKFAAFFGVSVTLFNAFFICIAKLSVFIGFGGFSHGFLRRLCY